MASVIQDNPTVKLCKRAQSLMTGRRNLGQTEAGDEVGLHRSTFAR